MSHNAGGSGLINFYLDTSDLSIEEVKDELLNLGIKPSNVTEHFENLIKKQEAKLRIDKGKKVQERFDLMILSSSVSVIKEKLKSRKSFSPKAQFAFNKLEDIDDETVIELLDDELKLEILKGLGEGDD